MILIRIIFLLIFAGTGAAIFLALKRLKNRRTYIIIYAVLLVLVLADAVCDRRSILGHTLRWLEGESGVSQTANDYLDDIRNAVNPLDLQQWAMAMIQQSSTISPDKVPAYVRAHLPAYIHDPKGFYLEDSSIRDGAVWLGWGGGLGHFGLCVGPPAFKIASMPDDNSDIVYVEWKPGIYCWADGG